MSLAATIPTAVLDTVLGRLALLFLCGTGGDVVVARHAAAQMLATYQAETADELRLAAEIISLSFHALEALSQAATPDMPLTKVLRLRGSAVSLSRETHKSERRLDRLQTARLSGTEPHAGATDAPVSRTEAAPRPSIDKALALIEATRQVIETGGKTWTQSYQKRQTARRINEKLKKNQAAHAARTAAVAAATLADIAVA